MHNPYIMVRLTSVADSGTGSWIWIQFFAWIRIQKGQNRQDLDLAKLVSGSGFTNKPGSGNSDPVPDSDNLFPQHCLIGKLVGHALGHYRRLFCKEKRFFRSWTNLLRSFVITSSSGAHIKTKSGRLINVVELQTFFYVRL
jgi:hypothetical protein